MFDNSPLQHDRYNLDRFVQAQDEDNTYARALIELRAGRKNSHWMWFVFPQYAGLGRSAMAQHYAIKSLEEAWAYARHPILGSRLIECVETLLALDEDDPEKILGSIDALKLRSCLTLFALCTPNPQLFDEALAKFYNGQMDDETVELVDPGDDPYEPYG